MEKADIWSSEEKSVIDSVSKQLINSGKETEHAQLHKNLTAVKYQAEALSLYPSILKSNHLGDVKRTVETLVKVLSEKYRDEDVFVMPTKAVLGKSIEIGKINLLYLVNRLAEAVSDDCSLQEEIFGFIMNRMLSIMTEDVLLELLGEPIRTELKEKAAKKLAEIWESRDTQVSNSFPELRKMWLIRRESMPVFGTLLGTHEYISLYKNADEICRNYVLHASTYPNEASALEEFLFGLSFEELGIVKKALSNSSKGCVKREEVASILGKESIYLSIKNDDPLELYRFFNHRRKRAISRWHAKSNGPRRTFEEYFMAYILAQNTSEESKKTQMISE
ncbi:hypothetical protein CHISP_1682 [Chitinispirillum alkaliphilum]|nr:hypothetical protein CHISP_1682 [Chitinispirillum alkaliphilum]